MTVFECLCGFASGSASSFQKHLVRHQGDSEHKMVLKSNSPEKEKKEKDKKEKEKEKEKKPQPRVTRSTSAKGKNLGKGGDSSQDASSSRPEWVSGEEPQQAGIGKERGEGELQAHPPDRTWFSRVSETVWGVSEHESGDDDKPVAKVGPAEGHAAASSSLRSGDVDAAWEAIDELIEKSDDDDGEDEDVKAADTPRKSKPVHSDITALEPAAAPSSPGFGSVLSWGMGAVGAVAATGIGWRRTSDQIESSSGQREISFPNEEGREWQQVVSVSDVEAVLLWEDPVLSGKVFGIGLYALICLGHIVTGVEVLQPSTALAGCVFLLLVYKNLRQAWLNHTAQRKTPAKAARPGLSQERDLQVQRKTEELFLHVAYFTAPYVAAIVATIGRRLSGKDSVGASVWLGLTLWAIMLVGELKLMSQPTLAQAIWVAAFGLPWCYMQCRRALDSLVEDTLYLVTMAGGQRPTLLLTIGVWVSAMVLIDAGFITRLSIAMFTSGAVLLYKARQLRQDSELE